MLVINYILKEAGWAILEISDGENDIELNISYLHESLKKLAETAIELKTKNDKSVIFMDEPGEHWFVFKKNTENEIEYGLIWYEKWASWNLIQEENLKPN